MFIQHPASQRDRYGSETFRIERVRPGRGMSSDGDLGLGPLGAFDHAFLKPRMVVQMHEHRNDEIITYVRKGLMHHVDNLENRVPITVTSFSVMNAGRGMSHEESVPTDGDDVELLQIFVRPNADNLKPGFQSHTFGQEKSTNVWRPIFGPEGSEAPLVVRNQVWFYDAFINGNSIDLPLQNGLAAWLYVFSGSVSMNGHVLDKGDGVALIDESTAHLQSSGSADLAFFLIDVSAPASRSGTLSR